MLITTYRKAPCPTPGKQRYGSEAEAQFAADFIFDSQGATLEPYECGCGLWHLTTPRELKGMQVIVPPARGGTRQAQRGAWIQPERPGKRDRRQRRAT